MSAWLKNKYYAYVENKNQTKKLLTLENALRSKNPTILVHQLGRAGSMSTVNTLRSMDTGMQVYHTHWLNRESIKMRMKQYEGKPESSISFNLRVSKKITDTLSENEIKNFPWHLVSIVREPVSRNVSAYFLNIHWFIDNANEKYNAGEIDCNYLLEKFLDKDGPKHEIPIQWFDREVKQVFGINIYEQDFLTEQGYKLVENNGLKLLLIRVEDLNTRYQDAFESMFGKRPKELVNTHISEKDEDYSSMYKDFLKNVKLPKEYLDSMYKTEYARYFYTEGEIEKFYQRWLGEK